jgi:orotate phosphoribosyltransferase-like protein
MSKRWKVNDGTQVAIGDKIITGGETFTATDNELDEHGSRPYVTEVRQQAAEKAENKAQAAPKPHSAAKDSGKS